MTTTTTPTIDAEMRECIASCLDCHAVCTETAAHCLTMGGENASREHQTLLADCAQACLTSAGFMLRMSENHEDYCGLCAEICLECAEDCERLASGDVTMQRCAETCRHCAENCRRMAGIR